MNENAKKWIEALRSGKYQQTKGALKNTEGFCCLGVACELSGLGRWEKDGAWTYYVVDEEGFSPDRREDYLPYAVRKWLGLYTSEGEYDSDFGRTNLTKANDDDGLTFEQIADLIESNPDGLFG